MNNLSEVVIDALLFDIGNVLVTFDFRGAMQRLAAQSNNPWEVISEAMLPLIRALEIGEVDGEAFVVQAFAASGFRGTRNDFIAAYSEIFEPNAPMIALVERWAPTQPLFLLSNTSALHLDYLRRSYPFFSYFRGGVYSHEALVMKPSDRIYKEVIDRYQLVPERTLYIDDVSLNTDAGRQHGFQTFTYDFRRHGEFEDHLVKLRLV